MLLGKEEQLGGRKDQEPDTLICVGPPQHPHGFHCTALNVLPSDLQIVGWFCVEPGMDSIILMGHNPYATHLGCEVSQLWAAP